MNVFSLSNDMNRLNCPDDNNYSMETGAGFFYLIYPCIVLAIFLGVNLSIHGICQYYIQINPDKRNLISGLEILFMSLSVYPFFLFFLPSNSAWFWVQSLISIPLIFFIPGFLLYGHFSKKNAIPDLLDSGFADGFFIQILVSILISGCIGLILAQLGLFSLFYLDLTILCGCLIIIGIFKPLQNLSDMPKPQLNKTSFSLIAILFIALALFFHPYPWIVGGRDPGVYVNTGINIANTGKIIIHDSFMANLDSITQKLFYTIETQPAILNNISYQGIQFPGFYITNAQTGEIVPQFFYLWPVWIAIFHSIFGLDGALYCTPFFAILALLSVYFTGKILYNNIAGLFASLILALNFAQIWYARYPTSEIFTMFIIFSGIFAFLIFMKTRSPMYSCLAAVCFGELLLTRIDAFLIIIPPLILIIGSGILGKFKKEHLAFLIPFIVFSAYAIVVAFGVSAPYTFDILNAFQVSSILSKNILNLSGFLVAFLFIFFLTMSLWRKKLADRVRKFSLLFDNLINNKRIFDIFTSVVTTLLMIYILYNYFIRTTGNVNADSFNFVKLSLYTAGFAGITATVIGIIILFRKKPFINQMFFLSIFAIFAVYQISSSNISTDHPWWVRRYLPVVIPSMIICMGSCLAWMCSPNLFDGKYRVLRQGTVCILLMLIIVPQGITDSSILFYSEYYPAIQEINAIAQKFDQDSIIVYKNNYFTDKIATPLYYIYNKTIVNNTPSSESLRIFRNWTESGKTIYVIDAIETNDIIPSPELNKLTYTIRWETYNGISLKGMRFDNYYNYIIIPQKPTDEQHTFNILIFNKTNPIENVFFLDTNWYGREYSNGIPTRWLSNNGTILCYSAQNRIVNLTFETTRFYEQRSLEIYSGETLQIQQPVPPNFIEVSVQIPLNTGENNIRLYIPEGCKSPHDIPELGSADTRCLSIAIRNLTIS
jgi:hypothetical protein